METFYAEMLKQNGTLSGQSERVPMTLHMYITHMCIEQEMFVPNSCMDDTPVLHCSVITLRALEMKDPFWTTNIDKNSKRENRSN